ncbi:MAG: hypothetical protein Q8R06_07950 [Polaromonas sp.]|uniref:hypothetical protein n=1 Tax=Polaromonas sp. TaxID=1869339 RepID=UPI00273423DD|nr:hypothetical protein [Polaromonas sp.]MDP3797070.1 hypothetical protein [Polaromonas sp.]UUZ72049.1 hypothetical protein LP415_26180 [Polaromonas sp. P1(28)-8]
MKSSHPRPPLLPGGPPVDDPDDPPSLPVQPDDRDLPAPGIPDDEDPVRKTPL